ncbi:myelin expression factor 2 isoform X2 [Zootermopsis nevadensis]|uniref:myelin expression factor 2 isoform X2 n=1 Tax=Zootermopsis nevadensis TaxID=136037 RepID=UPI000B8EAE26|nr:myelin expression factor 2 isoform X2 [Zootermopsis nevadensis]
MIKIEGNSPTDSRARDRSPLNPSDDRNDEDSNLSGGGKDRSRERERDRSRRGDRPSRFGPRNSSNSRERDRDRDRDRGGKKSAAERRIFVSNIAYEYRWQELKDLFRTEVGEVAYVELFHDENDKPRGCGIVEFESADSVKKAVEKMHRYDLKGRKLVVKEDFDVERDRYGRPQKGGGGGGGGGGVGSSSGVGGGGGGGNVGRIRDEPRGKWDPVPSLAPSLSAAVGGTGQNKWGNTYGLSPQFLESLWINGPLVTRVFVANLDYKVDEKKLKEVFRLAGKVVSAELSLDKEGKSRGFGVVEYEHPVEAVQAISMLHNQTLYDRKLTVRMDRVDHKPEGPPKLPEGLRGLGMGLGAGGNPLQDVSRNLPCAEAGLAGAVPGGAAAGLGTGLGAAALSNVVGPSTLGLGNTAGLQAGLAGVGGLGGGSLIGPSLGGGGDIGLGANLGGAGAFGGSGLGGGLGPAASGLASLGGGAGGLGGGSSSYGSGIGAGGSSSYGAGAGGGYGSGSSSALAGGSGFGSSGRDFDSLSAALGGGGAGGYNSSVAERDYRAGAGGGSAYANGPGRGSLGGGATSGNGSRISDTVIVKNLPPAATWQMLRDKFRECGDVKYAEMRGKDIGLVRFSSDWDAERAVHMMDHSRLEGRIIDVGLF